MPITNFRYISLKLPNHCEMGTLKNWPTSQGTVPGMWAKQSFVSVNLCVPSSSTNMHQRFQIQREGKAKSPGSREAPS